MTDNSPRQSHPMAAKTSKARPFKKFFCDRPEVFTIPAPAFKIWMFHYSLEGQNRLSWPSIDTLCEQLGMARRSVLKWRKWLIENGWLEKSGERGADGTFKVPVMTVKGGVAAADVSGTDGRKKNDRSANFDPRNRGAKFDTRPGANYDTRTGCKVWPSDRVQTLHPEVDPLKQVDTLRQVDTKNEAHRFALPDWIPIESWTGFVELRKRKRAPLTDRAVRLIVRKLSKFRDEGQGVGEVLDQSVERGWTGVFPLKPSRESSPPRHFGFAERDYQEGRPQNPDGSFQL